MKAMVLNAAGQPLKFEERPDPHPGPGQVLIRIAACGVCRTDLHLVDGELPDPALPIVPGHEIVGTVAELGEGVDRFRPGDRVGGPWLGHVCGTCEGDRSRGKELMASPGHWTRMKSCCKLTCAARVQKHVET